MDADPGQMTRKAVEPDSEPDDSTRRLNDNIRQSDTAADGRISDEMKADLAELTESTNDGRRSPLIHASRERWMLTQQNWVSQPRTV